MRRRNVSLVKPHVANHSGENDWYTPAEYIAKAKEVMGDIDLDPASSRVANETVRARAFYTAENSGLLVNWNGRVWMNPPYSRGLIGKFIDKLCQEFDDGRVSSACVLVNNATETAWFQRIGDYSSAVVFLRGRVKFIDKRGNATGSPLQGQSILYLGDSPSSFIDAFGCMGLAWRTNFG